MKSKMLLTTVLFAFAGAAFAGEAPDPAEGFKSVKTRAEVQAELVGYKAPSEYTNPAEGFVSTKTRAQVKAELLEHQAKVRNQPVTENIYFGG